MDPLLDEPSDPQTDWARLLPQEAFHEIMLILRGALPPPATDDPPGWARRDPAAMAGVAALLPVNAAEGRLAAQFVAADAWAMDCLRLAVERRWEFEVARKCRAQAMSLMREGKSALRVLLRMQAARRAVEGDEAASGRAAWTEHAAVGMMAEALGGGADGRDAGRGRAVGSAAMPAQAPRGVDEPHKAGQDEDVLGEEALARPGPGTDGAAAVSRDAINLRDTQRETMTGFPLPLARAVAGNESGGTQWATAEGSRVARR